MQRLCNVCLMYVQAIRTYSKKKQLLQVPTVAVGTKSESFDIIIIGIRSHVQTCHNNATRYIDTLYCPSLD